MPDDQRLRNEIFWSVFDCCAPGLGPGAPNQVAARTRPCHARGMPPSALDPPYDQLLATAERVARERPEVDLDIAREVFLEAATMLYNGLALDGLDDHDAHAVVSGLCLDLVAPDPGAAVRARSEATLDDPGDLHAPDDVSRAYLVAASILQL